MQEMQQTQVQSLGQEDPLEEEMATHSSVLAWRIPGTQEPGGLQSMGSQESERTEQTRVPILTMEQRRCGDEVGQSAWK